MKQAYAQMNTEKDEHEAMLLCPSVGSRHSLDSREYTQTLFSQAIAKFFEVFLRWSEVRYHAGEALAYSLYLIFIHSPLPVLIILGIDRSRSQQQHLALFKRAFGNSQFRIVADVNEDLRLVRHLSSFCSPSNGKAALLCHI